MSEQPEKLLLSSMDITDERLELLRQGFPEAFEEGRINFDTLKCSLGDWVSPDKERFGLNWAGKSECIKIVQQASIGTLLPMKDESVNFNSTENIIIEGDNLEALKLLQKSYYSKVKVIYIDPPYNTGNEFIYPDNFHEGLQDYLKYSGQVDGNGFKVSTNSETDGRYHSKWLNMMYPRLFLARNLLQEDGVIFVSIDDHEVHNLRALMNEIFGEENLIAQFVWQKKYSRDNRPLIGTVHEYILAYAKNLPLFSEVRNLLPPSEESLKVYKNQNNDPKGRWRPVPMTAQAGHATPSQFYEVTTPSGAVHKPPTGRCWAITEAKYKDLLKQGRIYFGKDNSSQPNVIRYLSEVDGFVPWTWLPSTEAGHTDLAMKEFYALMGKDLAFETPKPVKLIRLFLDIALSKKEDEIVLDFFAGTSTTAHALLEKNIQDGRNHKFILVQLPEKIDNEQFPTIAHIARERIRRAIKKLQSDLNVTDLGFQSYKLSSSNFKVWQNKAENIDNLSKTLQFFVEHVDESRSAEDILYELLLKVGYPLTSPIEQLIFSDKEIYSISEGALLICLDRNLTIEVIESMVERLPVMIICLDDGFKGNDQLKVNAVQTIKSHNQNNESSIVFRVV